MSKLTDYIAAVAAGYYDDPTVAAIVRHMAELLPAHDAEVREQAMREQMEADCAVVCRRCREGESVFPDDAGEAVHPSLFCNVPCRAWDIRAAYAKAHPKENE